MTTASPGRFPELRELLRRLGEGELGSGGMDRIEALTRQDKEARKYYIDSITLESELIWLIRRRLGTELSGTSAHGQLSANRPQPEDLSSAQRPTAEPQPKSPVLGFLSSMLGGPLASGLEKIPSWIMSPRIIVLTVASLLGSYFCVLALSVILSRQHSADTADHPASRPTADSLASLTRAVDPRWQGGPLRLVDGRLPTKEYVLEAGLVEFTLDDGAKVIIEGPTRFTPLGTNSVSLAAGRLLAQVPPSAVGFRVITPTAAAIDRGTEFGVAVDLRGNTDVFVLQGRVEVSSTGPAIRGRSAVQSVAAGQAVRVAADHPMPVRIEFDDAHFKEVRSTIATADEVSAAEDFLHGAPIWLGNLFDDPPGTRLADAVRSDTFQAVPKPHRSLGVERTLHDGSAFDSDNGKQHEIHGSWTRIAPNTIVDLGSLGWMGARSAAIANDAIGRYGDQGLHLPELPAGTMRPTGGISTRNTVPVAPDAAKIEEGIGMRADALLTFDLDEIRAAGDLAGRRLVFVCPRAGIADGNEGPRSWASVHFAVFVSAADGEILAAVVNGEPVHLVQNNDKIWSIVEAPGKPLKGDDDPISFVVRIAPDARYLTLVTANADFSIGMDLSVWSGACLKVAQ